MTLHLGILASGSGSNAEAIFQAIESGALDASIRLVFCNRPEAKVMERAATWGVPALCIDHKGKTRENFDALMLTALREAGVDTVVMAGYMRLVSPAFLSAFPNRILNIHPALLPAFRGAHGMDEALAWGVKLSGCSVHFVSEEMDCGALIIQAAVPVNPTDTHAELQPRIQHLEHRIYPQALQWLAEERLQLHGRVVHLLAANRAKAALPEHCLVWPPLEEGF